MSQRIDQETISAYFDGELSVEESARVERWLEESPEAAKQLEEYASLRQAFSELPRRTAPKSILDNVLAQVELEASDNAAAVEELSESTSKADFEKHPDQSVQLPRENWFPRWRVALVGISSVAALLLVAIVMQPLLLEQLTRSVADSNTAVDSAAEISEFDRSEPHGSIEEFERSVESELADTDDYLAESGNEPLSRFFQPNSGEEPLPPGGIGGGGGMGGGGMEKEDRENGRVSSQPPNPRGGFQPRNAPSRGAAGGAGYPAGGESSDGVNKPDANFGSDEAVRQNRLADSASEVAEEKIEAGALMMRANGVAAAAASGEAEEEPNDAKLGLNQLNGDSLNSAFGDDVADKLAVLDLSSRLVESPTAAELIAVVDADVFESKLTELELMFQIGRTPNREAIRPAHVADVGRVLSAFGIVQVTPITNDLASELGSRARAAVADEFDVDRGSAGDSGQSANDQSSGDQTSGDQAGQIAATRSPVDFSTEEISGYRFLDSESIEKDRLERLSNRPRDQASVEFYYIDATSEDANRLLRAFALQPDNYSLFFQSPIVVNGGIANLPETSRGRSDFDLGVASPAVDAGEASEQNQSEQGVARGGRSTSELDRIARTNTAQGEIVQSQSGFGRGANVTDGDNSRSIGEDELPRFGLVTGKNLLGPKDLILVPFEKRALSNSINTSDSSEFAAAALPGDSSGGGNGAVAETLVEGAQQNSASDELANGKAADSDRDDEAAEERIVTLEDVIQNRQSLYFRLSELEELSVLDETLAVQADLARLKKEKQTAELRQQLGDVRDSQASRSTARSLMTPEAPLQSTQNGSLNEQQYDFFTVPQFVGEGRVRMTLIVRRSGVAASGPPPAAEADAGDASGDDN